MGRTTPLKRIGLATRVYFHGWRWFVYSTHSDEREISQVN
jgi:hypothetical protein